MGGLTKLIPISVVLMLSISLLMSHEGTEVSTAVEMRCGWFSNPTPANASLFDRDGEWVIGIQGGYQAKGDWPLFKPSHWVETNNHYGYGCACMRVKVDYETHRVKEIKNAWARPLSVCRQDRSLRHWGFR